MSFRSILKMMSLAAVCGLVLVGCTRKPKIDLSGVRSGSGVGPNGDGGADSSVIGGDGFGDGVTPIDLGGDGFNNGLDENGNAQAGAWGDMNTAVPGGNSSDFIANAQEWNDIVYFAYDRAELPSSERPKVEKLAEYLLSNPNSGLVIEGHCDERGSDEYNRALSERRAMSVRAYLSSLGVADSRMQTLSFGEDKPAVANASTEEEHKLNRRAEFQYGTLK